METAALVLDLEAASLTYKDKPDNETHHIHEGNVQEHASCNSIDPFDNLCCAAQHRTNDHTNITGTGREEICNHGLLV